MSFDLGVWSSNSKIAGARAGQIYERLCRGERPAELQPDLNVDGFYRELTSHWPEIDSIPDEEVDVLISSDWSRAEEIYRVVQYLAQKHHLVLYDPQSDEVQAPESGARPAEDLLP